MWVPAGSCKANLNQYIGVPETGLVSGRFCIVRHTVAHGILDAPVDTVDLWRKPLYLGV